MKLRLAADPDVCSRIWQPGFSCAVCLRQPEFHVAADLLPSMGSHQAQRLRTSVTHESCPGPSQLHLTPVNGSLPRWFGGWEQPEANGQWPESLVLWTRAPGRRQVVPSRLAWRSMVDVLRCLPWINAVMGRIGLGLRRDTVTSPHPHGLRGNLGSH